VNNNTLCKRLNDIRTFIKWMHTSEKISSTRRTEIQFDLEKVIADLQIRSFNNPKVALTVKQMDVLSSTIFEKTIESDFYKVIENGIEKSKPVSKESLIRAKDFFLFLSFTGVRISDFRKLNAKNIVFNRQVSQKTQRGYLLYRGNDKAFKILAKYNYSFGLSDQKLNQYLKPLMRQFFDYYKKNYDQEFDMFLEQVAWRGREFAFKLSRFFLYIYRPMLLLTFSKVLFF